MKITRCKLSKKVQVKLLEFFVLEVTARSAADLLEIHHNSAALFYHKIRLVIEYHLNLEACELFDGEVAVFGLLKRNGKVYTACVKDTKVRH